VGGSIVLDQRTDSDSDHFPIMDLSFAPGLLTLLFLGPFDDRRQGDLNPFTFQAIPKR
jgi:hypothetical protein